MSGQIDGTLDDQTGTGTLDFSVTQTHEACESTAESDGSVWTFDGDPNLALDFEMTIGESDMTIAGSQTGGIAWSSGGRSGTCQIDVTYDFSGSGSSFAGVASGAVCGFDVTENVSY